MKIHSKIDHICELETRSQKMETRNWKMEFGIQKMETGSWTMMPVGQYTGGIRAVSGQYPASPWDIKIGIVG